MSREVREEPTIGAVDMSEVQFRRLRRPSMRIDDGHRHAGLWWRIALGIFVGMLAHSIVTGLYVRWELYTDAPAKYAPTFSASKRDYLAQEARNRSLGRAGELFVVELEARRLHAAGKKTLSGRVEHVAGTQGDGLGFDVLSFEECGRERLIEVKTTAFGQLTPFFVSRNELARSEADAEIYRLYRVFDFRGQPRLFNIAGAITASCEIEAVAYLARLAR